MNNKNDDLIEYIKQKAIKEYVMSKAPNPLYLPKFKEDNKENITEIVTDDNKHYEINLLKKGENKFRDFLIKYDGLLIYEFMPKKYKMIKVGNFKEIQKIKNNAMMLIEAEGTINNKPFFIIKNKIPISLNSDVRSYNKLDKNSKAKNGIDLCYDTEAFYTHLEYVTMANLQAKGQSDLGEWFKKYWLLIVIIIILVVVFIFTPYGRQFIEGISVATTPKPTGM
jgi:hypothetical protein